MDAVRDIFAALLGDASPEERARLMRLAYRITVTGALLWAYGLLTPVGLHGFARADAVDDKVQSAVEPIRAQLGEVLTEQAVQGEVLKQIRTDQLAQKLRELKRTCCMAGADHEVRARMEIDKMIGDVLRREGGYVDNPNDRGKATNFGITQATLAAWRQRPVTADDVRNMAEGEARAIYLSRYLTEPRLDRIHDPYVLALAFDCAVNHGPHRVIRWLQQAVGVVDDGVLGPVSEVAINTAEPVRLYQRLLARRIVFYGEIVSRDRSQAAFILGWLRRVAEFVET